MGRAATLPPFVSNCHRMAPFSSLSATILPLAVPTKMRPPPTVGGVVMGSPTFGLLFFQSGMTPLIRTRCMVSSQLE